MRLTKGDPLITKQVVLCLAAKLLQSRVFVIGVLASVYRGTHHRSYFYMSTRMHMKYMPLHIEVLAMLVLLYVNPHALRTCLCIQECSLLLTLLYVVKLLIFIKNRLFFEKNFIFFKIIGSGD